MLKVYRYCHKAPKKHHTIPADVLPNDSDALFNCEDSSFSQLEYSENNCSIQVAGILVNNFAEFLSRLNL